MPLAKRRRYNMPEYNLSIVVISKNEEKHIAKCLDSVFAEIKAMPATEVILVDSRSTDKTIDIASKYNVKIAVIDKKHKMTPGLGRLIGTQLSKGYFIFFLDGDKILCNGWLKEALSVIDKSDSIAGVIGNIEEGFFEDNGEFRILRVFDYFANKNQNSMLIAKTLDGTSLFKKEALEKTGGYDPFMRSCEDTDLFLRIEKNKFVVAWTSKIMCRHITDNYDMSEIATKIFKGYYSGLGVFVRKALKNRVFLKALKAKDVPFRYIGWLFLGMQLFFISFIIKNYLLFFLWLIMTARALIIIFIRQKDKKYFFSIIAHIFGTSLGLIVGFLFVTNPDTGKRAHYDYKIVKD